jgi:antitoxin (DNA-binding transcriptional repressor) of toxin-antitoxin stability system
MKRYTVAQVRERLAEALDQADAGVPVLIERRGVRYRITTEANRAPVSRRKARIDILDPAVADGQWTWAWTAEGLTFTDRRER